jgi:membrane associated rhomboid family serine protease
MTDDVGAAASQTEAPTCYRHPDRVSYIRCQRCERHICVQCQSQAPVGVLCPDCVSPRSSTGTSKPWAPRVRLGSDAPVVTYTLIGLNVLVYLLQWIPGLNLTNAFAYAPFYSFGEYGAVGAPYEPWRMLTSVFTHSTGFVFHILLNMYTLWIFGQILERMLGRGRFLALYLISGIAGSVGVMFWAEQDTFVVGASGAIFGLMGAFLVIQRKLGGDTSQLLILVAINLVIGFLPGMSVAWQAHLGGLIGGALVGLTYVQTRQRNQRALQIGVISLIATALVLLALSHAPVFV